MPAESLGRFLLRGELGAGGMGQVYRAFDPTLQREIAIKILRRDAFPGTRGDLLAEARSASALNHPHICTVYDVGDVDGLPFIAMELVDGRPLSALIAHGGLTPPAAIRLAHQIAGALAHAHERGIVHGDVKGHNVIVTPAGDAKLVDFGLARTPQPAALDSITRAPGDGRAGAMAGTLPFMAPEILRGAPLSTAADVWAFGVLLYEMFAGTRPFTGGTTYEIAADILEGTPRPLLPPVSPAVASIIARCLEKSPLRRYGTAREPLAALEALPGASGSVTMPPRPARPAAWLVAGVVAVLLVAIVIWWWQRPGGRGAAAPAVSSLIVLPFDNLSHDQDQDYFAEGVFDALLTDLSRIPTLTVISRTSSVRYKALGRTPGELARELNIGAVVDGTVLRSGNQVRISVRLVDATADRNLWADEYTREVRDVLTIQGEVARAIASKIRASFAPADEARLAASSPLNLEAHEEFLKGRYHFNRRAVEQAMTHFTRAIALQADHAGAHAGLAQCNVVLPVFPLGLKPAAEALPAAVAAAERALAIDDRLVEAHSALGYARLFLAGFDQAEPALQRALAINPNDATTHFWLGAALASAGRLDAALEEATRAATLDPVSPIVRAGVSWMHHMARRFDQAVESARSALDLDPSSLVARVRLGLGLLHLGRHDEAISELAAARALGKNGPDLIAAVGYAQGRAGHRREALATLDELMTLLQSGTRYVSPFAVALIHTGLGNRDEAFRWMERAVDARNPIVAFLAVEPDLDPLRSDPRFAALLSRARR